MSRRIRLLQLSTCVGKLEAKNADLNGSLREHSQVVNDTDVKDLRTGQYS
jgi:hypothetical protein